MQIPQQRQSPDPPHGPAGLSDIDEARRREAMARNGAAAELYAAGDYAAAAEMFEVALGTCLRVLGESHVDTLRVAGNFGVALVATGDRREMKRGIRLIEGTLGARTRFLGAEHPETLTALNALAVAHRRAAHADKALELAMQAVSARTRALGATHPDTLTSRMGLAVALAGTGDGAKAHRIAGSTLAAAEDALGGDSEHLYALVECGEDAGLLHREI